MAEEHNRIIYTTKVTTSVVLILSFAWFVMGVIQGLWPVIIPAGVMILGTCVTLAAVYAGYDLFGRVFWYFCGLAVVTIGVFICHPAGQVEVMYAASIGAPFLTFSLTRERRWIAFLVPLIIGIWLTTRVLGYDYFGPPLIGEEFAAQYVSFFSVLTMLMAVTVEMSIFAGLMYRYIARLQRSRRVAFAASQTKSDFLVAMSHEIRTPMNGVIGMVEILEKTALSPDQERILKTIHDSSFSLLRIIEDILDMSKIESGKLELVLEPTDLLTTVESAVATLRSYADTHNVLIGLHFDPTLPRTITCDAGRLRQIILNLLGNAIKFSRRPDDEPPGNVWIAVNRDFRGRLRISFSDDGIGIEKQFMKHLFEPFRQSEGVTTRRFGGSGLGLAIVKQLTDKMQGEISVSSNPGEGAEFTVFLPVEDPKGQIPVPSCPAYKFIVYHPSDRAAKAWQDYVTILGCTLQIVDDRQELWELAADADENMLFIIDMRFDPKDEMKALLVALRADFPDIGLLIRTRQRDVPMGVVEDGSVRFQGGPVLPTEFWSAVSLISSNQRLGANGGQAPADDDDTQPAASDAAGKQSIRILVAEDNEINQIVIKRQIEQLGYSSKIVENGREGIREWLLSDFDLVLTDCHMPEMDGFELAREIRKVEATRGKAATPIIAITANALRGEAERCIAMGMDGYLSKPVKLDELGGMIEKLLPKETEEQSAKS